MVKIVESVSNFFDRFSPDPDFLDSRWQWQVEKPFMKEYVASFCPYDTRFHKYKIPKNRYLLDPSCPSSRVAEQYCPVVLYSFEPSVESLQQCGWEYVVEHSDAIRQSLNKKLSAIHARCLAQFLEEDMPEVKEFERHWKNIQAVIPNPETAIDQFFKLVGISLTTEGLDECCFVGFEFQTGWDLDHGVQVLMHKERILAAVGMTELASPRGKIIDGIKAVQQYEPDPDDYLL